MIKLSKRLEAVARLVTPGNVVCDVGTDHGYIPIWLIQSGVCDRALAMDVNEGPLMCAREHIAECELTDYIVARRSDGLMAMESGECDSVVIAGMGGGLVIRILKDSFAKLEAVKELILQPQSDIELVRRFVLEHGFIIDRQDMVKEDGKYYMMFRCVHAEGGEGMGTEIDALRERFATKSELRAYGGEEELDKQIQLACDRYGWHTMKDNHPVLREYLKKEERVFMQIAESLTNQKDGDRAQVRRSELLQKQKVLNLAVRIMEEYGDEV